MDYESTFLRLEKNLPADIKFMSIRFDKSESELLEIMNIGKDDKGEPRIKGENFLFHSKGAYISVVNNDGHRGETTINSESFEDLKEGVLKALKSSKYSNYKVPFDENISYGEGKHVIKPEINPYDIAPEDKKKEMLDFYNSIFPIDKRIISVRLFYIYNNRSIDVFNTQGAHTFQVKPNIACLVKATAKQENIDYTINMFGGCGGYELIRRTDKEKVRNEIGKEINWLMGAKPIKAGKYTAILDNSQSSILAHECFGHACEADGVQFNISPFTKELIGKKIGFELCTLIDNPTIKGSRGFSKYDHEGILSKKTVLIDKGVLVNFMNNAETSSLFDLKPNGHAFAQDRTYNPIVRMTNTYFSPGDATLEEMMEDIKYGVFLKGWKYGWVEEIQKIWKCQVLTGRLIENGELTTPIRETQYSGSVFGLIKNVDMVGKEIKFEIATCGKENQRKPESSGGPYLRIKNLDVGGI